MASVSPPTAGGCTPEQYSIILQALHDDSAAATALCKVFATSNRTEEVAMGLNTVFMVLSGALVFIMHGGFAMLEAGAIRSKNAMNILLQTVLDGAASAVMWYLVGYGFAYGIGDNPNGFIGDAVFGLSRYVSHESSAGTGNWTNWFFQWAFCATAATIPAGAVAERFNFNAYLGYSLFLGGFVYPVVVHWVWCRTGWLGYGADKPLLGAGMIDFAGSGVVHMTGGLAGLTGAVMVGPRLGRFDMNGNPVPMPGHSAILVVLGTVLLWFGWYGFNPGSALAADTAGAAAAAGRAAVTTTLSGAAGGLTCLALAVARNLSWDLASLCNGMLVGFVAITAGCALVEPWAALLCGCLAAALFEGACLLLLRMRVDDVVSAGPMHGACGAWGVVFVGLLAKQEYIMQAYPNREEYPHGLFYGGGGRLLASQVIGVLVIGGWVLGTMGPFFLLFKAAGALRISAEMEQAGLDVSKHGGSAYNIPTFGSSAGGGYFYMGNPGGGAGGSKHPHLSGSYGNGGTGAVANVHAGGGGGGRAVGDAIMRAQTMGGLVTVGSGGGGGAAAATASPAASGGGGIVAPFAGLSDLPAPAAGAAVAPLFGHGGGDQKYGNGGLLDSSFGSNCSQRHSAPPPPRGGGRGISGCGREPNGSAVGTPTAVSPSDPDRNHTAASAVVGGPAAGRGVPAFSLEPSSRSGGGGGGGGGSGSGRHQSEVLAEVGVRLMAPNGAAARSEKSGGGRGGATAAVAAPEPAGLVSPAVSGDPSAAAAASASPAVAGGAAP